MIIGIAGKKGSGKDTLGNYLCEKYDYRRYAFGDPVKEVCRILFGFNDEQLYGANKEEMTKLGIRPREAFQGVGTEFGRKFVHKLFPDLDIKEGELWIDIFRRQNLNKIVVTDVRFQNEADAIKEKGGKIIMLHSFYAKQDMHESEKIDVQYDYLIENNGTKEELYLQIDNLLTYLESV